MQIGAHRPVRSSRPERLARPLAASFPIGNRMKRGGLAGGQRRAYCFELVKKGRQKGIVFGRLCMGFPQGRGSRKEPAYVDKEW